MLQGLGKKGIVVIVILILFGASFTTVISGDDTWFINNSEKADLNNRDTITFFSLSSDGHIYNNHAIYSTARGSPTGTAVVDSSDEFGIGQMVGYFIYRGYLFFSTAAMTVST